MVVTSEKPVPYRLAFRMSDKGMPATLTSPLLDPALHQRGGVVTYFRSVSGVNQNGPIALDAFEAASLAAYLRDQASVRRQLERELDALLKTWDERGEISRGGAVWKQTKIETVHFSPRKLPTPAERKLIQEGYSKEDAKTLLRENFDAPRALRASASIYSRNGRSIICLSFSFATVLRWNCILRVDAARTTASPGWTDHPARVGRILNGHRTPRTQTPFRHLPNP